MTRAALQISVIIPTFCRPTTLDRVLSALCNQTDIAKLAEVLVICDGPDETTRTVAQRYRGRLPLQYIEQEKQGVSRARNLGLSLVTAGIILLLDDDVVPGPDLIREHLRFHQERPSEKEVLLGYVTWHSDFYCSPFMQWYGEFGGLFGYGLLKDNHPAEARYFYSCNISMKRSFLTVNGGFSEQLTVLEDYELGFRLEKKGMQLFHKKAAIGYHYQTFTFDQACRRLATYSEGLNAFLLTEAGKSLARKRRRILFQCVELVVRVTAPLLRGLVPMLNRDIGMPRVIYRLLYWYYGTYQSFWSRADKRLVS